VSSGPDLFVVCKNCGSEVSSYITECPYCGTRLRKRAPKLDRPSRHRPKSEKPRRLRRSAPRLPKMRPGEIPGIRIDARPYATIALVLAAIAATLAWRIGAFSYGDVVVSSGLDTSWWHVFTAPFLYDSEGYAFVALVPIAVFGWLLERRYGPIAPLLVFFAGGAGGLAIATLAGLDGVAAGANGAALAMVCAWAVPDLLAIRRGDDIDGDLLGAAVIAAVVLLVPLVADEASPIAGFTGVLVGLLLGWILTRIKPAA
jgi:membrane associated rhomboid family serine protease